MKHTLPIQLRFNDIDGLGHVNNAMQANYFDLGRLHYFEAAITKKVEWTRFPMVIASVKTDFFAPIFLSEVIEVKTKVKQIGDKSLSMFQELVSDKGIVKSTCESVMVGFDMKNQCSAPISEEMRSALSAFEGVSF